MISGAAFWIALAPVTANAHGTVPQVRDLHPRAYRGEYYPGYYNYHRSQFGPHYSYRPATYLHHRPYHYTRFYRHRRHQARG
jgi:hypothetical protein